MDPKRQRAIVLLVVLVLGFAACTERDDERHIPTPGSDRQISPPAAPSPAPEPSSSALPASAVPQVPRNPRWATPLEHPGLPNLHKVNDQIYRGAQPTPEGFRELQKLGIRTVVNLRSFHSDRDEMGDVPLAYEHITMKAWHPEDKEAVRFLRIVTDPARTPVFVHCQHGADRTGTMCAIYRMAVQGWSADDAIEEMIGGGYGFHDVWGPLLKDYLEGLDMEAIKSEVNDQLRVDS